MAAHPPTNVADGAASEGIFGIKKTFTKLFSNSKWNGEDPMVISPRQPADTTAPPTPMPQQPHAQHPQPGSPLIAAFRSLISKSGSTLDMGDAAGGSHDSAHSDMSILLPPAPSTPSAAASPFASVPPPLSPGRRSTMLSVCPQLPPSMQRPEWCMDDYVVGDQLYKGYASIVYKAVCKRSREMVVLKCYHMPEICELYQHQIYREVRLHSMLQHENIVTLYAAFQEGPYVVMVEEYCDGGHLFSLLQKYGGRLSERVAVQLVLDPFIRVLQYMHSRGIIHRDIKPENILFTKAGMCLKLADFGLAIDLKEERAVTRAGTLDYMAPEVLRCPYKSHPQENKELAHLHYTNSVDAWAVGVLTYELLVGSRPFTVKSKTMTEQRIKAGAFAVPGLLSDPAKDFVQCALRQDPMLRPTIMEMVHHPWIELYRARRSMRHLAIPPRPSSPLGTGPPAAALLLPPTPSVADAAATAAPAPPAPRLLQHAATSRTLGTAAPPPLAAVPLAAVAARLRDEVPLAVSPSPKSVPCMVTHLNGVSLRSRADMMAYLAAANSAATGAPGAATAAEVEALRAAVRVHFAPPPPSSAR